MPDFPAPPGAHGSAEPGPTGAPLPRLAGKFQRLSPNPLGRGGMGEVFLARDESLDREVAVKHLALECGPQPGEVELLRREALLLARIRHPNVIAIHELVTHSGALYLILEYLPGGCWQSVLDQRERLAGRPDGLPWPVATRAVYQAAQGLSALHAEGIVHRDVKPANLLRTVPELTKGFTKVADFGIARFRAIPTGQTGRWPFGSPHYMSPEQWDGGEIGPAADVYALAATYHAVLTGRSPFVGNYGELKHAHRQAPFPDLRTSAPEIPDGVVRIIRKAAEKNPAHRYPTAAEFVAAIEPLLAGPVAEPPARIRVLARGQSERANGLRAHDGQPSGSAVSPGANASRGAPESARPAVAREVELPLIVSHSVASREQDRWGARLGGAEWVNELGMKFRLVPPGQADLGAHPSDPDGRGELPRRRCSFPAPFWAATFPVTCKVLRALKGRTGAGFHKIASEIEERIGNSRWTTCSDLPAGMFRFQEAEQLCAALSDEDHKYRLPTEDEWEYFARAGACGRYWWEESAPPVFDKTAAPFALPKGAPVPAGHAGRAGENAWGLDAVLGNVSEWCYPNPLHDSRPVARGGDYSYDVLTELGLTRRCVWYADTERARIGVRVIRELSPHEQALLNANSERGDG